MNRRILSRIGTGLWVVALALLAMVGAGVAPAMDAVADTYPEPVDMTGEVRSVVEATPRPRHDAGLPTAVFALGSEGANAADVLAPYEVLAVSGRFNVITAAPARRPVPLTGGLDVVPDFSFAELARRFPAGVDVVFAPAMPDVQDASSLPVRHWLARQAADGATVVGVCVGAELLAGAGLLDGRPATSHWLAMGLGGMEKRYPDVRWQHGVRYVDDGDVVTTAGVLSGVDGALRILERHTDESVARRAAGAVGWTHYRPGAAATTQASQLDVPDSVALLNLGYREPAQLGVALTDGVGEIELASVFRTYTELSYVARPYTLTLDGSPIRSRHGLTFVPRSALTAAPTDLDRLVVPGAVATDGYAPDLARAAAAAGLRPEYVHTRAEFPFDAALRDLAATTDVATATWVAKTLEYPVRGELSGPAWPWSLTAKLLLAGLLGVALAIATVRVLRARPGVRRFLGHYVEMLLAMTAGMLLLGGLAMLVWPGLPDHPVTSTLVMAADMTVGMAAWMAFRGHSRRLVVEMSAAMVAPFLLLLVPLVAGVISAETLNMAGHTLMLLSMLAAMLLRRQDYTARHDTGRSWRRRRRPAPVTEPVTEPAT